MPAVVAALSVSTGQHLTLTPTANAAPLGMVALKVPAGQTVVLFKNKTFTIKGTCIDNGGGDFTAQPWVTTNFDNSMYTFADGSPKDLDFDIADGAANFPNPATGTVPAFQAAPADEFYGQGTNPSVDGFDPTLARIGTGVHLLGADCTFIGKYQDHKVNGQIKSVAKFSPGETKKIYDSQYFSVDGTCIDNGGGSYTAQTSVRTKKNDASVVLGDESYSDPNFDIADGSVNYPYAATGAAPTLDATPSNDSWISTFTGHQLVARVMTGVNVGGAACTFAAFVKKDPDIAPFRDVAAGEQKTIFTTTQFEVQGICTDNGGGDFTAKTKLVSKSDGSVLWHSSDGAATLNFDKGNLKTVDDSPPGGTTLAYSASHLDSEVFAQSGRGFGFFMRMISSVHRGKLGRGDCSYTGVFFQ